MRKESEIVTLLKVDYDVKADLKLTQPDVLVVADFCEDDSHENVCITYADSDTAIRRRACLKNWFEGNGYHDIMTAVRGNKLYIIKRKGEPLE